MGEDASSEAGPQVSRRFLLVGLTGGIASGKSIVAQIFRELGAVVIDADVIARQVVEPGEPAWRELVAEFGEEILLPDRTLDRKKLGALIFADPAKRTRLEQITHPRIQERRVRELERLAARGFEGVVIQDAALLIEVGGAKSVDRLVVVWVDGATQLRRLMARDGITEAEARQRIASQVSLDEKARLAHHVIDNSGPPAETRRQVEALYQVLLSEARGRAASGSSPRPP